MPMPLEMLIRPALFVVYGAGWTWLILLELQAKHWVWPDALVIALAAPLALVSAVADKIVLGLLRRLEER